MAASIYMCFDEPEIIKKEKTVKGKGSVFVSIVFSSQVRLCPPITATR